MRNSSVWRRAFGLTRTVVEGVGFDERVDAVIGVGAAGGEGEASVRAVWSSFAALSTGVRVDAVGGRWIWARRGCSSRPTRRGCGVGRMG